MRFFLQQKRNPRLNALLLTLLMVSLPLLAAASWDFSKSSIAPGEIMSGGPPRDGIPALTGPKFVAPGDAAFMRDDEQVLGVYLNGVAKAYPTRILSWHELVNDQFGDLPVLVSWWPLAYAGVVYSRQIAGRERLFGVSGLLYRSNVLMYDRGTESLWSQIKGEAVTGPLTGTELDLLPSTLTSWKKWRKKHPETLVLSIDTGYSRNYSSDPYLDYYAQQTGFRSFFKLGPDEKEKELVVGVVIDGQAKAYPLKTLRKSGQIEDTLAGRKLTLSFAMETDSLAVIDGERNPVVQMTVYWFVWKAIWPETERY